MRISITFTGAMFALAMAGDPSRAEIVSCYDCWDVPCPATCGGCVKCQDCVPCGTKPPSKAMLQMSPTRVFQSTKPPSVIMSTPPQGGLLDERASGPATGPGRAGQVKKNIAPPGTSMPALQAR
jgi:hypothetical protein